VIFRQGGISVDAGHLLDQWPGQRIVTIASPIGEWRDPAGQAPVTVRLDELALRQRYSPLPPFDRPIAEHRVREVDVKLVRGDIRALRHEAHVAERAGVRDLVVGGCCDRVELAVFRIVDQIK
jgi:hypothetical protein